MAETKDKTYSQTGFSFEVLPPLRGAGTASLYSTIERLMPFGPQRINITNHQSEWAYKEMEGGLLKRYPVRLRPGSVAIAAAIKERYHIEVVPHIICSGATAMDIEYDLLDLQFLGISNILLLRGDKAAGEKRFKAVEGGYSHTIDLIKQVKRFNDGFFVDDTPIRVPGPPFSYGVACYPEKHEEAPNRQSDIAHLKEKQDLGAEYAVTQLFYDNDNFFKFVEQARAAGITIPIIPGIKPLTKKSQLSVVPKTFHCDIPQELAGEAAKCNSDEEIAALGIEWALNQCRELRQHGFNYLHFYTISATTSIIEILKRL